MFVSATFDVDVTGAHFDGHGDRATTGVLLRQVVPVERLFMTYLETGAMDRRYKVAEAVLSSRRGPGYSGASTKISPEKNRPTGAPGTSKRPSIRTLPGRRLSTAARGNFAIRFFPPPTGRTVGAILAAFGSPAPPCVS